MIDLLQRLKQRKLVQWALAYVAAAFALIQVLDVVAQRFGWPEVLERVLILALVLGFFVTLVLAWYHGEKGAQKVRGTELLILALLLAIGGGWLWRVARQAPTAPTAGASEPASSASAPLAPIPDKSVAVLPLTNESDEKGQQYFSDGLSEDLINALSQFAGLKVISRNSSFQFRDSKLSSTAIGQALGVAHLLEGSVRRLGDDVRISTELVNATDGSTLWSQHYDRPYKDLFALQDDITNAVAAALKTKLLEGSTVVPQSDRPPGGNLDAWNAYSQGRYLYTLIDLEDAHKAIGFYQQAIAIDPRYAHAWASLSIARSSLGGSFLSGEAQRQAYAEARTAAEQALRLDPNMASAHDAHGRVLELADFDWSGAEAEYRRALELAPADGQSSFSLGRLLGALGQSRQAVAMLRHAIATDPRNGSVWNRLSWYLAAIGQFDEAEQAAGKAHDLVPGSPYLSAGLAIALIYRGDTKSALIAAQQASPGMLRNIALAFASQSGEDRAAADTALKNLIAENSDGAAYQVAEVYGLRRDPDNMFLWLDRAWDTRDSGIGRLLSDPFILRYQDDPRFAVFCRKVGLPTTTDAKAMP